MSGRGRGIKKSAGGRPKSNPSWGFFIFKQTNPDPDDEAENGTDGLLDLDSVDYSNLKPGEVLGHCKVPGLAGGMPRSVDPHLLHAPVDGSAVVRALAVAAPRRLRCHMNHESYGCKPCHCGCLTATADTRRARNSSSNMPEQ